MEIVVYVFERLSMIAVVNWECWNCSIQVITAGNNEKTMHS